MLPMGLATRLGMGFADWWGWHFGAGLIFGLSLFCVSTLRNRLWTQLVLRLLGAMAYIPWVDCGAD